MELSVRHKTALKDVLKYPKGYPTTFRIKSCKELHEAGLLIRRNGRRGPSSAYYLLTQKGRAALRELGLL